MAPSTIRLFLAFLLPRVAVSILFTIFGFHGAGGDPEAYHLMGRYLKDVLLYSNAASFGETISSETSEELEIGYRGHVFNIATIWEGWGYERYLNTVMPILFIHALLYLIWDNPLMFPLLNSVVSSLVHSSMLRRFGLLGTEKWLFILNPVSLYYCGTHFKESLVESFVILFFAYLFTPKSNLKAAMSLLLVGLFRYKYMFFLLLFYLARIRIFRRLHPLQTFGICYSIMALGVLVPDAVVPFIDKDFATFGAIYSIVFYNDYTTILLGPLVGLILPIPFLTPLSYGSYFGGIANTLYGLFYYFVLFNLLRRLKGFQREDSLKAIFNALIVINLLIGFMIGGASGTKDRYFAPFIPLLVFVLAKLKADPRKERKPAPRIMERESLNQARVNASA